MSPVVPRADQSVVGEAPLPGARLPTNVPVGAFGVAQAPVDLTGVRQHVETIARDAWQKADEIATTDIAAKLSALETRSLHDPQTGALNQHGANAFGLGPSLKENWDKSVAEIEASASTDQQAAFLRRAAATHWANVDRQFQGHVANERQAYDHERTINLVAGEHDAAVANFTDPARVSQALATETAAFKDFGRRNGWSPEQTTQAINGVVSKTHLGILEQILAAPAEKGGGDLRASAYLAAHREELQGADRIKADTLTEAGSVLGESQRQADIIMRGGVESAGPPTLDKALADAGTIVDPRVREATERRVRQAFMDQVSNAHEQQVQAFHQASEIVEKTSSFDAIPLALRVAMSPEQNEALQHRVDQIRHPKEYGDQETYFQLLNMASLSPQSRQQFMSENLLGYKGLSSSERTRLLGLQRQISLTAEGRAYSAQMHAAVLARKNAEDTARLHDGLARAAKIEDPVARKAEEDRVRQHYADVQSYQKAAAAGTAGDAAPPAVGYTPKHPLDGVLTPAPVLTKPTAQMLEGAAKNPKYAAYLRSMHIDLPAVLPTPAPEAKKKP